MKTLIAEFGEKYSVSELGVVINELTNKEVPQHDNGTGYIQVALNKKPREGTFILDHKHNWELINIEMQ